MGPRWFAWDWVEQVHLYLCHDNDDHGHGEDDHNLGDNADDIYDNVGLAISFV